MVEDGPVRVVQLVTQREPAGAQRVAHQLHQALCAAGLVSEVLFLYRRADAFEDEPYEDLRSHRPGPAATISLVLRLARRWRSDRPTAVIAHTFHANVIGLLAATLARVRCRIAVHHVMADLEGTARRSVMRVLRASSMATHHVYVSRATLDSFGSSAARRAVVIHNGVDLAAAHEADAGSPAVLAGVGRPLVVAVGRLAEVKDHRTLLRAMAEVPEVDLVIVGDGELRAEIAQQIDRMRLGDRVRLPGNLPPRQVSTVLRAADVVVQPSRSEAFSMVILEAMAAGCALVVSDIPAHREALRGAARYHPVGDAPALASELRALLADRCARRALGEEARVRAANFDYSRVAEGYLALLHPDGQEQSGCDRFPTELV